MHLETTILRIRVKLYVPWKLFLSDFFSICKYLLNFCYKVKENVQKVEKKKESEYTLMLKIQNLIFAGLECIHSMSFLVTLWLEITYPKISKGCTRSPEGIDISFSNRESYLKKKSLA